MFVPSSRAPSFFKDSSKIPAFTFSWSLYNKVHCPSIVSSSSWENQDECGDASFGNPGIAEGGEFFVTTMDLLLSFHAQFGVQSNKRTEVVALAKCLRLFDHLGFSYFLEEIDSKIVIDWLIQKNATPEIEQLIGGYSRPLILY